MKIKEFFLIGSFLFTITSFSYTSDNKPDPILTRHDKEEDEFFKIAERFEKYICHLNLPDCEGTIIADQWVITAAHCAIGIHRKLKRGKQHFVIINDVEIEADKVIMMHKKWKPDQADIALIHLKKKPRGALQAKLYTDEDEVDKLVYMLGRGDKGDGLIGVNGNDGKQRGATNRIEEATPIWIKWTFDHPDTQTKYLTEYEGISGPGDSGGPAFILKNDSVYLAGISSWQDTKGKKDKRGKEGLYGVVENYTRVSQYINWINENMKENAKAMLTPELQMDVVNPNVFKQYVGNYLYEPADVIIKIYTKEQEKDAKLYLQIPREPEIELIATGAHKFSMKGEEGFGVEFKNAEDGVFKELMLIQPQGNAKAIRKEKWKIDDLAAIDKKLIERSFSGVVLVAQNDSILFNKAYGRKNDQEDGLNDLNTVFDICSITKQFTGAAILKLHMENKIALSDKLSKYFDAVPPDKKNITIHQLLTHSSGLTSDVGDDYDAITEEKFLKKVFHSKLVSPIGKAFNYSNIGYSLLGLIIEKTSGMEYETFLDEAIFKPSKMHHTGYVIPDWKGNEVANGYLNGTEAKKPNEENWSSTGPYLNLKGNGGILTRASDLLLWSQSIRDNTVLDEETTSKYLYPHFEFNGMYTHYGYGWGIENNDSENKLVTHGGASDLFATDMWMYPNKGITIIVLSNTMDEYAYSIAQRVSDFLLTR